MSSTSAMFGRLDYTGWLGEQQSRLKPNQSLSSQRWCEWSDLKCNWPKIVWNFIWLHVPCKTVTRAEGIANTRAMSGWDRQCALLPYISLLHVRAVASSERAFEVVTHFSTLARGLAWEDPPQCCVLALNVMHHHHHHHLLCSWLSNLMQTKYAFSLPLQSQVPIFTAL